ncbi:squalene synthase HpnC [Leeia aquatica]|uniref:Squalene synthase HpnC n=1 Tax=Leeia aquatica TaxID=2725557 RepID=A0A847S9L0_9NEIS|nr:squalene synthase HpnC [Leeia aquatica]NLR74039.1 squalene synthase HpnC [Leeia aquatica]
MPVDHYENFPVASVLLPRRLRRPIEVIYAFARSADDLADEGEVAAEQRLAALQHYCEQLEAIGRGETPAEPLFQRLAVVIREHDLPLSLFHDLLDAFSQDVVKTRYADFGELVQYCRRSANPVGRLLLHLYGRATPHNLALSDGICTALQLINFWQDVAIDWQKQRVYLPQEDLQRFGVTEAQIAAGQVNPAWQALMRFEIERTRKLLQAGAPLARVLPGRMGLELRMIVLGGERILKKLWDVQGDVFTQRPVLKAGDWLYMLSRACWPAWPGKP